MPDEKVLNGIDLQVASGETIAIAGSTGAGKSSFNLITRFYEFDQGDITIDDQSTRSFRLDNHGSIAAPGVKMFSCLPIQSSTTLRCSIHPSAPSRLLMRQKPSVHDYSSLPNGHHYNVQERGVASVRQRQLIAFCAI